MYSLNHSGLSWRPLRCAVSKALVRGLRRHLHPFLQAALVSHRNTQGHLRGEHPATVTLEPVSERALDVGSLSGYFTKSSTMACR